MTVLGSEKILDSGPDTEALNLVLVGDGYRADDQDVFRRKSAELVRVVEAESWFRQAPHLNVWRVDVASKQPGTWLRYRCPGAPRETYFESQFCWGGGGIVRLLGGNTELARQTALAVTEHWSAVGVLVNSYHKGGSADGPVFFTTTGRQWTELALHELGHALFDLGDEYDGSDSPPLDVEPPWANVTRETRLGRLKWRHLVDEGTPIPTLTYPTAGKHSPIPPNAVGLFEGAGRKNRGLYRGAYRCRMRNSSARFCRVCEEVIIEKLRAARAGRQPPEAGSTQPQVPTKPPVVETPRRERITVSAGATSASFEDSERGTIDAVRFLVGRV